MLTENEISKIICDEAIHVHKILGPGLLESVYRRCMAYRLVESGLVVREEVGIPLSFETLAIPVAFRADMVVEEKVIIEVKSISALSEIHFSQVLTYLRLTDIKLGLLLNFNSVLMKNGIRRIVNKLVSPDSG